MNWLALVISAPEKSEAGSVMIRIPKKVVKLATRRNRIRRLIKETLRLHFYPEKNKKYTFRLLRYPGDIGISDMKEMVHAIWPRG